MSTATEQTRNLGMIERVVDHIELAISQSRKLAVIMIFVHDVDRLCASTGHVYARETLNDFRNSLEVLSGEGGEVVQLSDRKFVVLLGGFRNQGHVQLAAQKIQRLVHESCGGRMDEQALHARIGIALDSGERGRAHEIMRCAEIALLDGWRNSQSITFYQEQAADELIAEWNLEHKLSEALEAGDLELHYQPKMRLDGDGIDGTEALIRWLEPERGWIPPDVFVNVAENSGCIKDLTYFSIQRACRQLNQWKGEAAGLTVAVNLTPSIIKDQEIVHVLKSATSIWNVDPELIVLEITESALMTDPRTSHELLTGIRRFGAKVSIDDFGTGYSSLAYLKDIPADELKIDRSFVMNMLDDSGDYKIVEHAISIAKSFGLRVVAEGVANGETLEELRALGCDYAQGYHICKPLPPEDFLDWYLCRER